MPSYVTPKRATEFIFYIQLTSQADTKLVITNPTIAAGDFTVSTDGGAAGNLATLPTVTPAGGTRVKVTVSAVEMTGDNIAVSWADVAGAQWCSGMALIQTGVNQIDDLADSTDVTVILNAITGVPAAVWGFVNRTLTSFGTLVANIVAALAASFAAIPAAVWAYIPRTLTSYPWLIGKIEEAVAVSTSWADWMWERYTTKVVTVQVVDAGGYPVNITNWSLRWTAGTYLTKSTAAATITVTAPLSGVFTFTISAAESLLFPYGDTAEATMMSCKGQEPGGGAVHLIFEGRMRYKGTLITSV